MNLLKILFGNLTKTGVEQPEGQQTFYNDPSQAGVALAKILSHTAQPQTSDISGELSAPGDVHATGADYTVPPAGGVGPTQDPNTQFGYSPSADPAPTFNPAGPLGPLAHMFRPSFADAAFDEAGNVRRNAPALTKSGVLLKLLSGGLQGVMDAGASGAFDAVPGRSPFFAGVQGAQQMPIFRAQKFRAQQHQDLEDQALRSRVQNVPADRAAAQAQQQATLEGTRAETGLRKAQTTKALQGPASKDSLQEQRQNFADEHGDMFADKNEQKNFVLYGQQPKAATKNPNEWQLRIDAANGDEDAQAALDQRFSERKTLTGMRRAGNKQSSANDAASAESYAAQLMNRNGGDPDKALAEFDKLAPRVTDPKQQHLGPIIRKALRGRKRINPAPKPQSFIDKILSGDVEGGLNQLQQPKQ